MNNPNYLRAEKFFEKNCRPSISIHAQPKTVYFIQGSEMETLLKPDDFVGISFFVATMAMMASAVFFFLERDSVAGKWKTSVTVAGLITGIAAVHYFYMRDVWVATGASPTVFRYVDWLITVPLQMIEFYLILAACTAIAVGVFWRLMIGTMVMVVGG